MVDIEIHQLNNSYIKVICEPSISQELCDFFTFDVPGAQFSPQYKSRYWDGKIRLYSIKTNQVYAGLASHVEAFAEMQGYSISKTMLKSTIPELPTKEFIEKLNLPVEPRDYQIAAFLYAISKKRTVLLSPTASGKSLIIYLIASWLLSHGKKQGLLIVPTVSLVEQMYSDFKSYGLDVDKYCQKIYQGQDKAPTAPLVISTWQSIFEMPKSYFSKFDFIIGDEAHTFAAKSLTAIMTRLVNCDYRIGTTGTLDNTKVNKLVLEGLFGPVKKFITTKELIDRGQLADFSIKCCLLQYADQICKDVKGKNYQEEIDFLIGNENRNNFITNLTLSLKGNTLVLYSYVAKHGKVLFEMIQQQVAEGRKVFFIHGGVDALDREAVRAITEKETDAIIIASYGTFSTGINIRNLHNIVFASPTKSKIRTLQSIGRGLRLGDNKAKATLYDLADDLRVKSNANHTNFTLRHFEERVKFYSEEKFTFTTTNIRIA
jgi:superfamily II DNA or RNA helicase